MIFHVYALSVHPTRVTLYKHEFWPITMDIRHGYGPSVRRVNNPLLRPQGTQRPRRDGARPTGRSQKDRFGDSVLLLAAGVSANLSPRYVIDPQLLTVIVFEIGFREIAKQMLFAHMMELPVHGALE